MAIDQGRAFGAEQDEPFAAGLGHHQLAKRVAVHPAQLLQGQPMGSSDRWLDIDLQRTA